MIIKIKIIMDIGVVGKPNVGKSTFFKALTLADVGIENYPFMGPGSPKFALVNSSRALSPALTLALASRHGRSSSPSRSAGPRCSSPVIPNPAAVGPGEESTDAAFRGACRSLGDALRFLTPLCAPSSAG